MSSQKKNLPISVVLAIGLLAVIACATTVVPTYEPTPEGFDASSMCNTPVFDLAEFELVMSEYTGDPELKIRATSAFQSPSVPEIWFHAADIQGPGYEGIYDIAVWWSRSSHHRLRILDSFAPYNAAAEKFTELPYETGNVYFKNPETMGEFPEEATGGDLARQCVLAKLRGNEDLKPLSEVVRPGRFTLQPNDDLALLVQIDASMNECTFLGFETIDDGKYKWYVKKNPDGSLDYIFTGPMPGCVYNMLDDASSLISDIDLQSIPSEYRQLIES